MALPLPKVVADTGPGGGVVTAMGGMNALANSNLQNKILAAQAQYAPQQAAANAFLTNQEANWAPYKYQSQALSNPMLWMAAQNNPALMSQLKQIMSNPMQANSNQLPFEAQPKQISPFQMLMNKLGSGNSSNAMQQPSNDAPTAPRNALTQSPSPSGSFGAEPPQGTPEHDRLVQGAPSPTGGAYNTPAGQGAASMGATAGLNGVNPYSSAQAEQKAQDVAVSGEASNQTQEMKDLNTQTNKLSTAATQLGKLAKGYSANYDKSFYKGARLGSVPSEGYNTGTTRPGGTMGPEQLTDTLSKNMQTIMRDVVSGGGQVTDAFGELVSHLKPTRSLDPDAKKYMTDATILTAERMKQARPFIDQIRKNNPGITTEQIVGMLNEYNDNAAPFDYETGKPMPENNKRLKEFTSPQAVQTYINTGEYNPGSKGKNNEQQNNVAPPSESGKPGKVAQVRNGAVAVENEGKNYIQNANGQWEEI